MKKILLFVYSLLIGNGYLFARCEGLEISKLSIVKGRILSIIEARVDSAILPLKMQEKVATHIQQKSRKVKNDVDRSTEKVLKRWRTLEVKLAKNAGKVNQLQSENTSISGITKKASGFKEVVMAKMPVVSRIYDGDLDTLLSTTKFLGDNKGLTKDLKEKWSKANDEVNGLQDKLQETERLKSLMRERMNELKNLGFMKEYNKLSKEVYYYGERVREYRELIKDKSRLQAKAMDLLRKTPAYNDFISRNSALAGLFNLGNNYNVQRSLEGLQVRTAVEQIINQRIGTAPGAAQIVGAQLNEARSKFDEFKAKFPQLDNAAEMPDFKPKPLKAKSLFQRLEFGGNIQFQKSSRYFPTTTDIAGQVGYKFHKNGVAGLGIAYKLGMGTGWDNISFSHRGVGFRSFIDWKIKGNFFLNGGYERNKASTFRNLEELKNWKGWQQSGLLGISRKYKKQSIIILYDFLAARQLPQADKVKIRFGRNF